MCQDFFVRLEWILLIELLRFLCKSVGAVCVCLEKLARQVQFDY